MLRLPMCLFVITNFFGGLHGDRKIASRDGYREPPNMLKDSCPDKCVFSDECGCTCGIVPGKAVNQSVFLADSLGHCTNYGPGTNIAVCGFNTRHECVMNCGGEICVQYKQIRNPIFQFGGMSEKQLEAETFMWASLVKAYQQLNNASINYLVIENLDWYADFFSKNDPTGKNFMDPRSMGYKGKLG